MLLFQGVDGRTNIVSILFQRHAYGVVVASFSVAAGLFKLPDLTGPDGNGIRGYAVIAAATAAVVAVFTVHFLTRYFRKGNLNPFAAYCCLFGLAMVIYNA